MRCDIRAARPSDAATIAELSAQLGYAVPAEEIAQRLRSMADDHAVIVACAQDGTVIGWMDIGIVFHLQAGKFCEIGGLVVAEQSRGYGIGRELLVYAEKWGASRGMKKMLVRSNAKRADAHRFYLRENYEMVKTSTVFEKKL